MHNSEVARPRSTALVTGASMGIGLELARQFAAHGHDLILVARHRDALERLAESLHTDHGISARVMVADLADPNAPMALFDEVMEAQVQVDFLVNNAGFGLAGEFSSTDIGRELDMIQVNVTALTHLTKLFLPPMVERRSGRIMQVASIAAFVPGPLMSVYYATKAYVLSFSQALSEELRNSGVTVTALCPGPTATNFAETANFSNSRVFSQAGVASASGIARYGYGAMMRGKRIALPTFRDRVVLQAARVAPRTMVARIVRKLQENR